MCVCVLICISSLGSLSRKALPIYTRIGHVWGILSSSFLPLIGITQLCSFCQAKGLKCYLVLICISLTTNEFEHRFMCLLAFGVSFSVNYLSYHLPILLLELMSSSCCFAEFLVDSRCWSLVSFRLWKKSQSYCLTLNWSTLFFFIENNLLILM